MCISTMDYKKIQFYMYTIINYASIRIKISNK